ncbi:hypothetical protein [[Acholeplasma] multilocale]|uniref:hypothetical protein n=1 Tax=[Acholeplasma] multilocale TaxID=264638 RepID=UPI0012EC6791|nr:hypothetical protein [[Acholeplasma] multilocale]
MTLKVDKKNLWIIIPVATVFILTLLAFIVSTFYDLEINQFFEKGMGYEVVKWWVVFLDRIGYSELFTTLFIVVAVIGETLVFYCKKKKKTFFPR